MTALIVLLVIIAFLIAKSQRSTKLWWTFVIAILSGLLTGIVSETCLSDEDKQVLTEISANVSSIECMQSLVATVTEGTTIGQSEVAGYIVEEVEKEHFSEINNTILSIVRDPPVFYDDS